MNTPTATSSAKAARKKQASPAVAAESPTTSAEAPRRRRGRPPKTSQVGPSTPDRLLKAAADAWIESGFERATVSDIATRAGVTANAIYNHFQSREELLVAGVKTALEGMKPVVRDGSSPDAWASQEIQRWLSPSQARARRLTAELHVAGARHEALGQLVQNWQDEQARDLMKALPGKLADRRAAAKAYLVLLAGVAQVESLAAVPASTNGLADALVRAAGAIFAPLGDGKADDE